MANVEKVKRKLWTFGMRVKDVSDVKTLGFDLIVNDMYHVKVVKLGDDYEWVEKNVIVAIVNKKEITYHVCKGGKCWVETSPLEAFPKVDN